MIVIGCYSAITNLMGHANVIRILVVVVVVYIVISASLFQLVTIISCHQISLRAADCFRIRQISVCLLVANSQRLI